MHPTTPPEGRPVPVPPHEYVRTLPHLTAFACLYVRDEQDRPLQLRSVFDHRPWQFPGGNQDHAHENPYQTALREAFEETGLRQWPTEPELLLAHFLPPETAWPMAKVGFVFDGGQLSAAQCAAIRLDPDEHSEWAVHSIPEWEALMLPRAFARLQAVENARQGTGPRLIAYTPPPQPEPPDRTRADSGPDGTAP